VSQGVYVIVGEEIDGHYERARAAGAEIVRELHDTDYGSRDYMARDSEGNLWSFGTTDRTSAAICIDGGRPGRSIELVPTATTRRRGSPPLRCSSSSPSSSRVDADAVDAAPAARLQLGISETQALQQLTGQQSSVRHVFASLYQAGRSPHPRAAAAGADAALKPGATPPLDVAQGKADTYLVTLNGALASFGGLVYVRPCRR
jgi:hypothetical protein